MSWCRKTGAEGLNHQLKDLFTVVVIGEESLYSVLEEHLNPLRNETLSTQVRIVFYALTGHGEI